MLLPAKHSFYIPLLTAILTAGSLSPGLFSRPALAQYSVYCHQSQAAISEKDALRQRALQDDSEARNRYRKLLQEQGERLRQCRSRTWPQDQAIWIRLYPCDTKPGALEAVLDRIVNRGYNQVYVEVFYNGQVLLPQTDNPTPWGSVVRGDTVKRTDLLAQVIQKGRERGLKVYAWLFSLNFGYTYAIRPDRQPALARNGQGMTSLAAGTIAGLSTDVGLTNPDEAFVDPYHPQVRQDYEKIVRAVAQRRPDGMLFDYIRYPKGVGSASIASRVKNLWIYSPASQQSLFQRALNRQGQELIRRFVSKGSINAADLRAIEKLYPKDREPLWQGRIPAANGDKVNLTLRAPQIQLELWQLAVAHAMQGVVEFLEQAAGLARQQGLPSGAVFFPEGNQTIGQGYDSRLQPWDRFPGWLEWHPMAYGVCGDTSCIVSQVARVVNMAPPGTQIEPVLAGIWQQPISNRPPLEVQMQALRQAFPQIKAVSHFAYSWQEPQSDRERKFCQVR